MESSSVTTSINQLNNTAKTITIFPNPANDLISIQSDELAIGSHINIVNTIGQTIITAQITGKTTDINVSQLSSGVYFIKTQHGENIKFIKN